MHMDALPVCMSMDHVRAWFPQTDAGSPGTGVTSGCQLPCWCLGLNEGPLEEQLVLFTAEPSPQSPEGNMKLVGFLNAFHIALQGDADGFFPPLQ